MGGCNSTQAKVDDGSKAMGEVGASGLKREEEASDLKGEDKASDEPELMYKKIHSACRWNTMDTEEISKLFQTTGALNCVDPTNKNTPLHIAAQNGHKDIVKTIISLGNKEILNAKNSSGNCALHMAVEYDYYDASKLLVDAGADTDIQNNKGIPARKGIDGLKHYLWMPVLSSKTVGTLTTVLNDCKENASDLSKSCFVTFGLKCKKFLTSEEWTEVDSLFKSVLQMIPVT